MNTPMYWTVTLLSLALAFLFWLEFDRAVRHVSTGSRRPYTRLASAGVMLVWALVTFFLSIHPFFTAPETTSRGPLFLLLAVALPVIAGTTLLLSSHFRRVLRATSRSRIVALFVFRAVFGALLLDLYRRGALPAEFALEAGLGDLTIGVLAPLVVYLYSRRPRLRRPAALAWSVLGLLDLANVLRLGQTVLVPWSGETSMPILFGMLPLFSVPLFILWHLYLFTAFLEARRVNGSLATGGFSGNL